MFRTTSILLYQEEDETVQPHVYTSFHCPRDCEEECQYDQLYGSIWSLVLSLLFAPIALPWAVMAVVYAYKVKDNVIDVSLSYDFISSHGMFLYLQAAKYNDGTAENSEIAKKFELKAEHCDSIAYWITVVFFAIAFACTFFGTVVIITITRIHTGLAVETDFIVNC